MDLYTFVQASPWLTAGCTLALGLLVGSFLNVVIWRLPQMMKTEWKAECEAMLAEEAGEAIPEAEQRTFNLAMPHSHCPGCGAGIEAHHNIPVLSWILLKGRCASCSQPISMRYPLVEAFTGLLSAGLALRFGLGPELLAALLLTWSLIALTGIDYDTQLLPDQITLPLMWAGLIYNSLWGSLGLETAFWGAVAGYLSLWTIFWLFKLVTGKEGMGYGDFKLLAALGAWFGWQMLPLIVILSSLVGAVVGSLIMALQRKGSQPMPFGPYLAGAGLIALVWGDVLLAEYLSFARL